MDISLNILLDQLRGLAYEAHVPTHTDVKFRSAALLPRSSELMRDDLIYVCRLSDALWASKERYGMYYICLRDRIKDSTETDERLTGMIILSENIAVDQLLLKVQDIFVLVREWYIQMQEALINEAELQTIIDLSTDIIGNSIDVVDSSYAMLACTRNIEPLEEISILLRKYGYHPEPTIRKLREHHRLELYSTGNSFFINNELTMGNYVLVNKIFRFHGDYFAHMVMTCDHRPLSDGLLELFRILTDVIAIYSERNWKDKGTLSHNYDSFFLDLLKGTLTDTNIIAERCKYLGLSAAGSFQLLKIAASQENEAILGSIGRQLSEVFPRTPILLYEHSLVALVRRNTSIEPEDSKLNVELENFLREHNVCGGISNMFIGLENCFSAYKQASLALKYGNSIRAIPDGSHALEKGFSACASLYLYQDYLLHILVGENNSAELWYASNYCEAMRTLNNYDSQHATNNLPLLKVYLSFECKAAETSQVLHMHRNNVPYRIGRIEELVGMSLDDCRTRLALQVSFLLMELYGLSPEESQSRN